MDPLERMKIKIGPDADGKDDVLQVLLDDAESYILGYTRRNKEQWLDEFNSTQVKIAIIEYNRLGLEGVQSRSEGSISTALLGVEDYPKSITDVLNPRRLVKVL